MDELKGLHNETAEQAALGCMFLDKQAAEQGKGALLPDDFYTPLYRTVFEAMRAVEAVDAVTVWNELQRTGRAELVGLEWIAKISTSVGSSVNLWHYIEELKRLSYLRRVVSVGREMIQAAYRQDSAGIDKALAAIRADGYGAGETKTLANAMEKFITNLAEIRASGKSIVGLPTGFIDLDSMLGGLRNGSYNILAARPSMGKSALALDIARNAQKSLHEENEKVVFFSLEMSAEELGNRGYTAEYLIDNDRFSVGSNDAAWLKTLQEVEKNSADFENGVGRIIINDEGGQSMDRIRAFCHGQRVKGIDIRLVVIDYLQLVAAKGENRTREIGEISRGLKQLAKDLDCPLLVLSQLSRQCEGRPDKRPILSDLRDSGDIEQDADVVMFLYRDEYYFPDSEKKGQAEVNIAKQRNGPTVTVFLQWIARSTTFRSMKHFKRTNEKPPAGWEDDSK